MFFLSFKNYKPEVICSWDRDILINTSEKPCQHDIGSEENLSVNIYFKNLKKKPGQNVDMPEWYAPNSIWNKPT